MIRKGESNKLFRVATDPEFVLTAGTTLTMKFTSPAGVLSTASTPNVTAPAAQVDDPDLGVLTGGTYFELKTTTTTFTETGDYTVCTVYEDSTTTPATKFFSGEVTFNVGESC